MWKQNIAGFIKGFLRSLPIAGIGIAVLAIPLGLLGQLAFALPILVVPIFAALLFIVLPLVVAATFRSVRGRGRWQFAGAITVYVALAVAVAWVIAPDRIDFDPSSEWSDDGIETVAFWDGESYDSTAPLALAAFLVERFVFLEKGSTLADPKIKQAFARKSGSDCDLHDPSVEFGMMQYFGHFGVCIVPETTGIDLKDAILIKRGLRGERLAAVAYQLIDGKPPVEVARWKRAKNFFPGFFPPRSYLNEVEFVFDVAGPTASKKFAASAFTLEEWVDAAYEWVGKTRLESSVIRSVKNGSDGNSDSRYSPIIARKLESSKFPPPKFELSASQQQKFTAIATAACSWRLDKETNKYVKGEALPKCRQTYDAWLFSKY